MPDDDNEKKQQQQQPSAIFPEASTLPNLARANSTSSSTTREAEELGSSRTMEKAEGERQGVSMKLRDLGEGREEEEEEDRPTNAKWRKKWYQLHRPRRPPPHARRSLEDAPEIPLARASLWSIMTFSWITPIMVLGYQRPLQATDLWKMDPSRECSPLADRLLAEYSRRTEEAKAINTRLLLGEEQPGFRRKLTWAFARVCQGGAPIREREKTWRETPVKPSLAWSLNEGVALFFWSGGLFKVAGDTAQLMGPLLTRQIIVYAQQRERGTENLNIGRGVGLALGLFFLTVFASICQHQFFWRSMSVGVMTRASLSTCIYRIAMVLSQKERSHLTNGKLLSHLSTDVSRVDFAAQWFHASWTAPIQLSITTILLCLQIGPSALVGIALFVLLTPIQTKIMGLQFNVRRASMKWTDQRSRLLQELLGSFAIVKYFTLEKPFLSRIGHVRSQELVGIRKILFIKAANQALAMSLPTLAAVVSFICYVGSGNDIDPAKVFTALSLFQLLRQPLMFLPRALSAIVDASNALERLTVVFDAEVLDKPQHIDITAKLGISVRDATFEWSTAEPIVDEKPKRGGRGDNGGTKKKGGKGGKKEVAEAEKKKPDEGLEPFKVRGLTLEVERGSLCALVGAVGSGKSSILQGLIGEMKQTGGEVVFGGKVAYCPQTAFIQNASLRENVVFGQPWEEERYWQAITDASLIADCEMLPDGDLTEIGEKGVSISGGQRQRINVARALYYNADVVIFDDPLSAVDAHVASALFEDAMLEALKAKGKTVLLVTHALHILSRVDYIYTIEDGTVIERGTFDGLMDREGAFSRLVSEFGGMGHAKDEEEQNEEQVAVDPLDRGADLDVRKAKLANRSVAAGTGKLEGRLMIKEKRVVGSIGRNVYRQYASAGHGFFTIPLILASACAMQGCQILSSVWLVYWQRDHFSQTLAFYMGLYAMFGVLQAFFTFAMGGFMGITSSYASGSIHHKSLNKLFYAPMSLFNSTPLGRILSVFGKDIDTCDNQLSDSLRMATMVLGNVLGSIVLISIFFPYFLVAIAVIAIGYYYFTLYYRASARELKRLDALLRSLLYSHFSESLFGLATVRAYGESKRFIQENAYYMDLEDRAYFLTVTNQRWLAIRLDSLGAVLSFVVALLCVTGVRGISAAEVGLVLTYIVSLTQQLGMVSRQTAEVENNMNAVERVLHYSSSEMAQEAAYEIPEKAPPADWPAQGGIVFDSVVMAYRKDLKPVLKGISMDIKPGEKIGCVGRTGAGKSSIMAALFRMVELRSGKISIDGIDISTMGLKDLRQAISIIPQDPQLFSGTLRSNLSPFDTHTDLELWDALKRAYLVPEGSSLPDRTRGEDGAAGCRFNLDTIIEDDGGNLSIGERGLVSLARALVKNSRIIVLDEATASADLETDAKIQATISRDFKNKTLIAIAHRVRTILSYDRILVLDAGEIVEFDTPLALFQKEGGVFQGMCAKSNITLEDFDRTPSAQ